MSSDNSGPPGSAQTLETAVSSKFAATGQPDRGRSGVPAALRSPGEMARAAWLPIFLAAALTLVYVRLFGVNVPYYDEWKKIYIFEHQAAGTLTFADLWSQVNEHRIFFPHAAILVIGLATKYNVIALMYCSVLLLAAALWMFIHVFVKDHPGRGALWLMVPVAFLTMSWRQSENLLMGIQFAFFLAVVASLATFFLLRLVQEKRWRFFFAASVALAAVATFSTASGLMAWPAGLVQILCLALSRRLKIALAGFWTLFGGGVWWLYFHDYAKSSVFSQYHFSPNYLLVTVGGALVGGSGEGSRVPLLAPILLGVALLLLAALAVAWVIRERQWQRYSFWLATMAFSLLTIMAITLGRSNFGFRQAMASRYSTLSIPLVVATYVILVSLAGNRPGSLLWRFKYLLIGLMMSGLCLVDAGGYLIGVRARESRLSQAFVVSTSEDQPDLAFVDVPSVSLVREGSRFLKAQGYSVFAPGEIAEKYAPLRDNMPQMSPATQFKIDGFREIEGQAAYCVTGWAVDSVHHAPAGGVYLVLDGKDYPLFYGESRPEVASDLHDRRLLNCGFSRLLPAGRLTSGHHLVGLKVLTNDRQAVYSTSLTDIAVK